MQAQNHQIVIGVVVTIIVFLFIGFFILVLVAYINQRKKKHIEEKRSLQQHYEQEILQTQLEVQEQTFKNISQEIHDNIGQALSFVKLSINTIDADDPDHVRSKLSEAKEVITQTIRDLRDLSKSLNKDYIQQTGLKEAIARQLAFLERSGFYKTQLVVTGEASNYPPEKELVVFRIIQELLNNVLKHAEASYIKIDLMYQPDSLTLGVKDDGKGFETTLLQQTGERPAGIGLLNIVNRLHLIEGSFEVYSKPGSGTLATIKLRHPES